MRWPFPPHLEQRDRRLGSQGRGWAPEGAGAKGWLLALDKQLSSGRLGFASPQLGTVQLRAPGSGIRSSPEKPGAPQLQGSSWKKLQLASPPDAALRPILWIQDYFVLFT